MLIRTYQVNSDFKKEFIAQTELNALSLMVMAESREQLVRKKGRDWIAGAVPFWAEELIAAMRAGKSNDTIGRLIADVAMSAWLLDSIYEGVTAEQFVQSDLIFTIFLGGAVKYDRVPAGTDKNNEQQS